MPRKAKAAISNGTEEVVFDVPSLETFSDFLPAEVTMYLKSLGIDVQTKTELMEMAKPKVELKSECVVCGKAYKPRRSKRPTCSRKCSHAYDVMATKASEKLHTLTGVFSMGEQLIGLEYVITFTKYAWDKWGNNVDAPVAVYNIKEETFVTWTLSVPHVYLLHLGAAVDHLHALNFGDFSPLATLGDLTEVMNTPEALLSYATPAPF